MSEEEAIEKMEEKEAIRKRKRSIRKRTPKDEEERRESERERGGDSGDGRCWCEGGKAGVKAGAVEENWKQSLGHSCRFWEIDWCRTRERKRGWKLLT